MELYLSEHLLQVQVRHLLDVLLELLHDVLPDESGCCLVEDEHFRGLSYGIDEEEFVFDVLLVVLGHSGSVGLGWGGLVG
jgi:hypothetical protein